MIKDGQTAHIFCERRSDTGFALVIVIWVSGFLALFALSFASSVRVHVKLSANTLTNANSQLLAEASVQIGVLDLLASHNRTGRLESSARHCRLPDGDAVALSVTDEAGRIDVNIAGADLIAALLLGIGLDFAEAARLTDAILDYRDSDGDRRPKGAEVEDYKAAGVMARPKNGPFDTIRELTGVLGMTPDIFAAISPFVTVHSGQEGIDRSVAPIGLVEVLARGAGRGTVFPRTIASTQMLLSESNPLRQGFSVASTRRAVLIRASLVTTSGASFVREAVVTVVQKQPRPPAATVPDPGFGSVARPRRPSKSSSTSGTDAWQAQIWDWRSPAATNDERRQLSDPASLPWC